ncbi:MAG: hypothetical protein RMM06_09310, partial [Armatimonadota bacterium]|nr:hypothetical protein [Armatimonadota bacterium]
KRVDRRIEAEDIDVRIRGDWIGRILGVAVFLLGVGILWVVFREAHQMFTAPVPSAEKSLPRLGQIGVDILKKLGLLVVMTLAGSLIANKGVQMYFAALGYAPTKVLEKASAETSSALPASPEK